MARNMMFYKVSLLILGVVLMACLVNADYSSEIEDDGYDSDVSSEGDSEGNVSFEEESGRLVNDDGQNFHEVDALGNDFVDFGAQTGSLGAFSWHADFPLDSDK